MTEQEQPPITEQEQSKNLIYHNIWNYLIKKKSEISILDIAIGFILGELFYAFLEMIKQINILDLIKLFLT